MAEEVWRPIGEFPGYSVSDFGRIRNDDTDRIMRQSRIQKGLPIVGLMKGGVQYKRLVARLVALAFCPRPIHLEHVHDTPINLDGDRENCCAANLMWRPNWFAVNYHKQFQLIDRRNGVSPFVCAETGEEFDDIWMAVIRYGLLYTNIIHSLVELSSVWPTNHHFEFIR